MKQMLLITVLLVISMTSYAATVAEIWNCKDIIVCSYTDSVTIMDLSTGNEALLMKSNDIMDITFDKTGKKLFLLANITTQGPRYEDPDIHTIKVFQMLLPATQTTTLTSFVVKRNVENKSYSYPKMHLNKEGNLTIVLTYELNFPGSCWKYTYNLATKVLSPMQKYEFVPVEYYKYKGLPVITDNSVDPAKAVSLKQSRYYNMPNGNCYDIYTKDASGNDKVLTDINRLMYSVENSPLFYCVSPDSTRLIFSGESTYGTKSGNTYSLCLASNEVKPLSESRWLGYEFIPYWLPDHRMVYLKQGAASYDKEKPSVNFLQTDGSITVLKDWDNFWVGPQKIIYRYMGK